MAKTKGAKTKKENPKYHGSLKKSDFGTIEKTYLWQRNYSSKAEIVINQGGSASGKTYAILDMLLFRLITETNIVISVVASNYPCLYRDAVRQTISIWANSDLYKQYIPKVTRYGATCSKTNSVLEFVAFPTVESAKGSKRDYLFCDEITNIPEPIFFELQMRTRIRTWVAFNPTARFWCHNLYEDNPSAEWIFSTHKANKYLPEKMHNDIERLKETNPERYRVYGLGCCGKVDGLCITDWGLVNGLPTDYKWKLYGLDWGFATDPTAITEMRYADGQLHIKEWLYQKGMTNFDIAEFIKANKLTDADIICDSAEPKSIEELRRLGIYNAKPSIKGPDSIKYGIDLLQSYHLCITRDSINLQDELLHYSYQQDKLGNFTAKPIDAWCHCIDNLRYQLAYKQQHSGTRRSAL